MQLDNLNKILFDYFLVLYIYGSVYIEAIQDMYDRVSTSIQTPVRIRESFPIKIGLYQGSALYPFIFTVIMEEIAKSIWETVP